MSTMLKKKGVALFVVMITTTVLALMMATFFKAYRSHFALTRSSVASQRAAAACDSVYQYVVYRVEHERNWGSEPFTVSGTGNPSGDRLNVTEIIGTHRLTGSIEALDATFEAEIYNNLTDASSESASSMTAKDTLLCRITARSGESTRQAEFVVRVAPLFDSSVLSRSTLRVDAETLIMRSLDPNRNLLRAEGDIYVPDILTGDDSKFLHPDDSADERGMLWAKGDIYSLSGGSSELIDEPEELADATKNSNGKIVSKALSDFSIYNLEESNLQLPENNKIVPLVKDGIDKPGRWNFVRRKADVEFTATYGVTVSQTDLETTETYNEAVWLDVLEYYPPDATEPTEVYRAANRVEDLMAQADQTVTERVSSGKGKGKGARITSKGKGTETEFEIESVETNSIILPDYGDLAVTVLEDDRLVFKSTDPDSDANLTFNLLHQTVTATSDATVTINGSFEVTSETDENASISGIAETPPPILDLGYSADGTAKAALVANGTLNIENGVTTGLGALISRTGDVRIQPINTDSVTVDAGATGNGLLVFAGGDVVLKNPDETSHWLFKGLVYARNGIRMEGHGQDATFEGTIVSLQENGAVAGEAHGIEFVDSGHIEFIYNPELLDAYVRELPGNRMQLELVYWKR